MKTHLRNYAASALLLLPVAAALLAAPTTALAQPAGPEVRSLEATADGRLEPGTVLTFTLEGTPRAQASVRIRGLRETVELREVARGEYVGRYTIKIGDRLDRDSEIRATVRANNLTAAANFELGEILQRTRAPLPPRAAEPRIERFGIVPLERLEPGADIRFALEGTPGGTVLIDLPGVRNDLALQEVRPGHYEGSYTIRRSDNFNPNRPIVATLRVGERVSTTNLPFAALRPAGDNRPPTLTFLVPPESATVPAGPSVHIAATFDDAGGRGVDPASVQVLVSGRNVTRDTQITRQSLSFWGALPPGRHTVEVTARDLAGNAMRKSWSFNVASGVVAVPPPALVRPPVVVPVPPPVIVAGPLAAQVINYAPNAEIGPDPVLIKGRTAPYATVVVTVHASPSPAAIGQPRVIYAQTLQADHEGIFSFTMVPAPAYPGDRYDIIMVARRGNLSQESRFMLIQRPN